MAKNVTVAGASYPSVPAIVLPQTGGGTATFYDCVGNKPINANGTHSVTGFATVTVDVQGGTDPAVLDEIHARMRAMIGGA